MAKTDPFQYYSPPIYHLPVHDLKCKTGVLNFCKDSSFPTKQPPLEIGPQPGPTPPPTTPAQPAVTGTMSLDGLWQSLTSNPLLLVGLAVGAYFVFGKKR